jgi:hypothetical protein
MRGRAGLDGRIAGWVTVERLAEGPAQVAADRQEALRALAERGALRFAVMGTWAEPVVDVSGLLWMLQEPPPADAGPEPRAAEETPLAPWQEEDEGF